MAALEAALLWLALALLGQRPGGLLTLQALAALPFVVLTQVTVGNLLSLYFPRRFDFGRFKQKPSPISLLAGIAMNPAVLGLVYAVFAAGRRSGSPWVAPAVYASLGLLMVWVYRASLGYSSELAYRRREVLVRELCQD